MRMPEPTETALEYWEDRYRAASPETNGRPSSVLASHVADRAPGDALELGCGKGDDTVWLAKQGWRVTAVDVSPTVLGYARANAERNGVAGRIDFQAHDLAASMPEIEVDLVAAMFLQTPVAFPRAEVLARAATRLRPGGLFLAVAHFTGPPWRAHGDAQDFPTARADLTEMALDPAEWREILVGEIERIATGSEGQTAIVKDAVIALERL